MLPLHPYQERAIKEAVARGRNFEAIDMGLGKTRIMIEVCKELKKQAFVVAPYRVAMRTWPSEFEKWAPGTTWQFLHGPDKNYLYHSKRDVDYKIINYDGLKWLVSMIEKYGSNLIKGRVLILDESSQIKNASSVRFKMLKKILHFFPYVFNLSATPMPGGYLNLWSQYYMLDQGAALGRSMDSYQSNHFEILKRKTYVKGQQRTFFEYSLREGYEEKIQNKVAHMTTRLDAEDYLELPDIIYEDVHCDMGPDAMFLYKHFEKNYILELGENVIEAVSSGSRDMKLRQYTQGSLYVDKIGNYETLHTAKIDGLRSVLERAAGDPVLCPIQFKFDLAEIRKSKEIQELVGKEIPAIVGGIPVKDQTRILDAWDRGEVPLLLCHPGALSHGLNLQAGGRIICWYALTWDLEQYRQLIGRLARQGQTRPVLVTNLTVPGTIDTRVASVLTNKDATQNDFLLAMKNYAREVRNGL